MIDKAYSSAMFDMLERETWTVRKYMAYPITRVELLSVPNDSNPNCLPRRIFTLDPTTGQWVEECAKP